MGTDSFQANRAERLRDMLTREPEIRPAVVAQARLLAQDPSYPPHEILRHVASLIVKAPDLSSEA
jgi:hypothetical protein